MFLGLGLLLTRASLVPTVFPGIYDTLIADTDGEFKTSSNATFKVLKK